MPPTTLSVRKTGHLLFSVIRIVKVTRVVLFVVERLKTGKEGSWQEFQLKSVLLNVCSLNL